MHALLLSVVLLSTAHGAALRRPRFPPVELYGANTNEALRLRPFDERGRTRKAALVELTHFLRCRQSGRQHRVDPRLMRALYNVGRHYAPRRLEVFSGYRTRAYCSRPQSRHLTASAVDFRVAGVANESLVAWLRATFHPAGVGYYPNGAHVHLDVDRARDTYWVDAGDAPVTSLPNVPAEPLEPPMDDPALVD